MVRISWARPEARDVDDGRNPGARPHGAHAGRNIGVSVLRAGRELELDPAWAIGYDPVERWWGVEVEFPPALDELFGVTNNKQAARNFAALAKLDEKSIRRDTGESLIAARERLREEGDPQAALMEIALYIRNQLSEIRKRLKDQTKGERKSRERHAAPQAEDLATIAAKERTSEGHVSESDRSTVTPEQQIELLEEDLLRKGYECTSAQTLAAQTVSRGRKFVVAEAHIETPAFFSVDIRGQAVEVTLNKDHPAHERLLEALLAQEPDGTVPSSLDSVQRLAKAAEGLQLLLFAWARLEDETPAGPARDRLKECRYDWGRMAKAFLVRD
jgi:hypothetical protein